MPGCANCRMKEMGCASPLAHPYSCKQGKGRDMKLTGKIADNNFNAVNQNHYISGHHKIPRIWVVVADKHRARIFTKPNGHLEQIGEAMPVRRYKNNPKHVVGRVFSSASRYIRHCLSYKQDQEFKMALDFVGDLALFLEQAEKERAYDRLVLAAPPKMLGNFRKLLNENVQSKIIAEVNKDLTKMSEGKLMEEIKSIVWF